MLFIVGNREAWLPCLYLSSSRSRSVRVVEASLRSPGQMRGEYPYAVLREVWLAELRARA